MRRAYRQNTRRKHLRLIVFTISVLCWIFLKMSAYLDVDNSKHVLERGRVYLIGRKQTVETNFSANVEIDCESVNKKHAIIDATGDDIYVLDLQSRSGTHVNGRRIPAMEKFCLRGEASVRFGENVVAQFYNKTILDQSELDRSKFNDCSFAEPRPLKPTDGRISDSFFVPDTQSLADGFDTSGRGSSKNGSRRSAADFNITGGLEEDFWVPETQELLLPTQVATEKHVPELSTVREQTAEYDDMLDGTQIRICTQLYNEEDVFIDENDGSEIMPFLNAHGRIKQAVSLNKTGTDELAAAAISEDIGAGNNTCSVEITINSEQANSSTNQAADNTPPIRDDRSDACTPDIFDIPGLEFAEDVVDLQADIDKFTEASIPCKDLSSSNQCLIAPLDSVNSEETKDLSSLNLLQKSIVPDKDQVQNAEEVAMNSPAPPEYSEICAASEKPLFPIVKDIEQVDLSLCEQSDKEPQNEGDSSVNNHTTIAQVNESVDKIQEVKESVVNACEFSEPLRLTGKSAETNSPFTPKNTNVNLSQQLDDQTPDVINSIFGHFDFSTLSTAHHSNAKASAKLESYNLQVTPASGLEDLVPHLKAAAKVDDAAYNSKPKACRLIFSAETPRSATKTDSELFPNTLERKSDEGVKKIENIEETPVPIENLSESAKPAEQTQTLSTCDGIEDRLVSEKDLCTESTLPLSDDHTKDLTLQLSTEQKSETSPQNNKDDEKLKNTSALVLPERSHKESIPQTAPSKEVVGSLVENSRSESLMLENAPPNSAESLKEINMETKEKAEQNVEAEPVNDSVNNEDKKLEEAVEVKSTTTGRRGRSRKANTDLVENTKPANVPTKTRGRPKTKTVVPKDSPTEVRVTRGRQRKVEVEATDETRREVVDNIKSNKMQSEENTLQKTSKTVRRKRHANSACKTSDAVSRDHEDQPVRSKPLAPSKSIVHEPPEDMQNVSKPTKEVEAAKDLSLVENSPQGVRNLRRGRAASKTKPENRSRKPEVSTARRRLRSDDAKSPIASVPAKRLKSAKPEEQKTTTSSTQKRSSKRTPSTETKPEPPAPKNRRRRAQAELEEEQQQASKPTRKTRSTLSVEISQPAASQSTAQCKIMTSMVDQQLVTKLVKQAGRLVVVVNEPEQADVLLMTTGNRTFKFLYALAKGLPILSVKWLENVARSKSLKISPTHYFNDAEFETRLKFSLSSVYKVYKNSKIFEHCDFMTTQNIQPKPSEIESIVKCAGGKVHESLPERQENRRSFLVSTEKDRMLWHRYRRKNSNLCIIAPEAIMQCLMHQHSRLEEFEMR